MCRTGRAVRCILERGEDMLITGARHPVLGRYQVPAPYREGTRYQGLREGTRYQEFTGTIPGTSALLGGYQVPGSYWEGTRYQGLTGKYQVPGLYWGGTRALLGRYQVPGLY